MWSRFARVAVPILTACCLTSSLVTAKSRFPRFDIHRSSSGGSSRSSTSSEPAEAATKEPEAVAAVAAEAEPLPSVEA